MTGNPVGWKPESEADHHMKCPGCGQWFDMRDLKQALEHVHDGDFEIGEGESPLASRRR